MRRNKGKVEAYNILLFFSSWMSNILFFSSWMRTLSAFFCENKRLPVNEIRLEAYMNNKHLGGGQHLLVPGVGQ